MLPIAVRKLWIVVLTCAGLLSPGPALAQQGGNSTHWLCWYNNDTTVRCTLSMAARDSDLAERQVKIARPAPGATPWPPGVRQIIRASAELLGVEVLVPLFSEPEDSIFVEQLANFTMCYGRSGCRVTFLAKKLDLALLQ